MKIVIIGYFAEYSKNCVTAQFPEDWTIDMVTPEKAPLSLYDADVVIPEHTRVDGAFLDKAPNLKLVQSGVGYDNVDIEECTRRGVWAANAAGVNAAAVAEHVLAFILAWFKNIPYLDGFMKNREDETRLFYAGGELEGRTIGIFGVGAIGKTVARYCNALNMRVIGHNRRPIETEEKIEMVTRDALYREADILTVHVPLNDQTRHIIGASAFKAMKDTAILINTSRGPVVNEQELIEALKNKSIAGACLDVFDKEPLRPDSPLRDLKNVLLTPHTAGMPDGLKFHKNRYSFFVNNIMAVMEGKAPAGALNKPERAQSAAQFKAAKKAS